MLARLSTTLSTNAAIAGLILVVLGAGGTSATLAAGNAPTPKPDKTHGNSDAAKEAAKEKAEKAKEQREDNGARPTDTHGFCVSQVAKTAPTEHSGEGADKVTHGTLVSAAAHACGKPAKNAKAEAKKSNGKAYGRGHGTGRPAGVHPASP